MMIKSFTAMSILQFVNYNKSTFQCVLWEV
jgi:hypothetical protein